MKTWKLLLAAMMALVMLFAVTALAEETPTEPGPGPACTEEDHAALEWVTVKEPTCAEAGSETRKCEYCGFTETREIPATGHTYTTWTIVTKPTCTQPGVEETVCDICNGAKQTREVEATGHAWELDEEFPAKEATCTEDGRAEQYYCPYCWAVTGGETIPATGHSWGKWVTIKEATEDEAGLQERTCSVCGATETREIGTMPETGVATVPTAALVSLMVLAMGSYVVLKKKESC